MTTKQDVEQALKITGHLDPAAVSAEVSLLTGARVKSQDLERAGGRSSTHALPLPDKVDRWCQHKHKLYRSKIAAARKHLEDALFIQGELLIRLHDEHGAPSEEAQLLAAEDAGRLAEPCSNCKRIVERTSADPMLGGRCRNCHDYLKRKLVERPQDLWAAA